MLQQQHRQHQPELLSLVNELLLWLELPNSAKALEEERNETATKRSLEASVSLQHRLQSVESRAKLRSDMVGPKRKAALLHFMNCHDRGFLICDRPTATDAHSQGCSEYIRLMCVPNFLQVGTLLRNVKHLCACVCLSWPV